MIKKMPHKILSIMSSFILGAVTISTGIFVDNNVSATVVGDSRIRVDINGTDGRKDAYSLLYDNWILNSSDKATETFGGVEFTISNGGKTGGKIKGANYKRLIKSDFSTPRLTMDGAIISDATQGGVIKLEIKGLSEGEHTLTTWHSFFDAVEGSSMSVLVDGEKKVENIKTPTRVSKDEDAGIGFCEFSAKAGKTVTVLIVPEGNGSYDNAVLNAFEIDSVNPFKTISNPFPQDGEEHFQQENRLSWSPGEGAVSHDVYLGTDFNAVNNANISSPEFKGNQKETTFKTENLSHMDTYYWRVDEHSSEGVTKGEVMSFQVAHLAFPSAEGYGRFAKGGRGGRVIEVTNLNDSGEGSLRDAIENEKGPRIIVFKVGGVINLKSRLSIPADGGNVYVAGQTAPGDGITLTHHAFGIYYASDVIIRHVRLRVGDENKVSTDGMGMAGADHSIIDHCSISWTTDEGTSSRGAHNITFQHNIIAEALNNSVHYDGSDRDKTERHSFAGSISGNIGSYHHNLLVNCTGRNWSLAGGMEQDGVTYAGQLDIRNNVIYNYKDRTTDGGVRRINFVNNYYKQGAVSRNMNIFSIDGDELNTGDLQMAYLSGNKMVKKDGTVILDSSEDTWKKATSKFNEVSEVRSDKPFFEGYVKTQSADEAYKSVLADVGANVPKQDYLDVRYIDETKNGTYTYTGSKDKLNGIIDSQTDVGGYPEFETTVVQDDSDHDGMPDKWELAHGLNPDNPEDRNGMELSLEGYTNLEMYLNELANDKLLWNPDPPFNTATPDRTDILNNTETPQNTATLKATATPKNTATSKATATPKDTATLKATATPENTSTSKATSTPENTKTPGSTDISNVTETPKNTATIKTTSTPEATERTDSPTPAVTGGKLRGDVDLNGKVELNDVVLALRLALNLEVEVKDKMLADLDGDGHVNLDDVTILLKISLKLL